MSRGTVAVEFATLEFATLEATVSVERTSEPRAPSRPVMSGSGGWVTIYQRWYMPMVRLAGLLIGDFGLGGDIA
jgi:hypothetical protein